MRDSDATDFIAMMRDVFGLYPNAKPPSDGQLAMFFRALAGHPIDAVRAGFDAHVKDPQRGRFPPLPADVIAQIEGRAADDGRPGADEAWAIAVRSHDENATIVWSEEIAQAWNVARAVMGIGDEVGARVAFRDAYNRLVEESRKARRPAQWSVSLGLEQEGRKQAVQQAIAMGRLTQAALPALEAPKRDPNAMKPLVESDSMPQEVRERLLALRARLAGGTHTTGQDGIEKQRTAALRQETQRRVDHYRGAQ
jgi:hypothetical protein